MIQQVDNWPKPLPNLPRTRNHDQWQNAVRKLYTNGSVVHRERQLTSSCVPGNRWSLIPQTISSTSLPINGSRTVGEVKSHGIQVCP